MPSRSFELSVDLPVPGAEVLAFLLDLRRHVGLHALMVSAQPVGSGVDGRGRPWTDWVATDTLPLGPWRAALRYPARLTSGDGEAWSKVRAALGTHLTVHWQVTDRPGGGSRMTEVTTVTAPRVTLGFAVGQARAAHEATFARLPGVLAAP
ncbi:MULTISPECIES: SRPBCC family protein [unclassified Deinococcus]|uniref:SRPBCC family protein n=1 Tax=unclassified Deinococcus TaxID=2623546 RepID=UPI001C310B21|nr:MULTISPECIES: SRPBCC family protein [unclassified Deinococcus]MDK2014251.1 SRPBCC family protein [Deinococcus sp. 43]